MAHRTKFILKQGVFDYYLAKTSNFNLFVNRFFHGGGIVNKESSRRKPDISKRDSVIQQV